MGGRTRLRWADLDGAEIVDFDPITSIRQHVDRALADAGCRPARGIAARNIAAVAGLVAAGLGATAVPGLVVPLTGFARLTAVPLYDPVVRRRIALIVPRGRRPVPAAEAFATLLTGTGNGHRCRSTRSGPIRCPIRSRRHRSRAPSVAAMDETIGAELDMIGILVTDMARSLAFYRLLGLEFPGGAETEPHVETTLRGGLRLALDLQSAVEGFHPGPAPSADGRVSVAFRLPDAAAVDAAWTRITGAGHASVLDPFDAPWGQRYATVRDPDGAPLDLFAGV